MEPRGFLLDMWVYSKASLILLALVLFVTENLVHYPIGLMSLLGMVQMVLHPRMCWAAGTRTLFVLFGLIWFPMLVASIATNEIGRELETSILYLHFLPAAYFVFYACRDDAVLRLVAAGTIGFGAFVVLDALVQLTWQINLLGYPYDGSALTGLFYPKQRLGLFLAVFAPLYLDFIVQWRHRMPYLWLLLIPVVIVMLMSLKRSAWVMFFAAVFAYCALVLRQNTMQLTSLRFTAGAAVTVVLIVSVLTVSLSAVVQHRLITSLGILSGDPETVAEATAYRVPLWRTGYAMFKDNWFVGVGPRGYRYAYSDYAADADFWMARNGIGQTHPHLLVLEVGAETGVLGLLGLLGFYLILGRKLVNNTSSSRVPIWLLCALTAWFPFNSHLAFYGSYWSTLVWLLVPIGLAIEGENREA